MEDRATTKLRREHEQMRVALTRIKAYQPPAKLMRNSLSKYGLEPVEAVEMAYDNVLEEARIGLKGVRAAASLATKE
jgi:hypothetical protein